MKRFAFIITLSFMLGQLPFQAKADLAYELSSLKGYTIIHTGHVTGYIDRDGKKHDDFEGCDFDYRLIIDYQYALTCQTYNYTYSYNPSAVILSNGSLLKLIVGDTVYDVSK